MGRGKDEGSQNTLEEIDSYAEEVAANLQITQSAWKTEL